ncbi:MAG: succinate dehydrogenase [Rhodospirillaceae bacterium]|nr:succinate dehydrogenase [Rhodospirillaceae bacterium]
MPPASESDGRHRRAETGRRRGGPERQAVSAEKLQTWLWLAQRISALVLAVAVAVHLINIIAAVQGGLTAAEIVARVGGNGAWAAFYGVFAAAAAVHAPIGVRTVLREMTPLPNFSVNALSALFGIGLLIMGLDAVGILYRAGGG